MVSTQRFRIPAAAFAALLLAGCTAGAPTTSPPAGSPAAPAPSAAAPSAAAPSAAPSQGEPAPSAAAPSTGEASPSGAASPAVGPLAVPSPAAGELCRGTFDGVAWNVACATPPAAVRSYSIRGECAGTGQVKYTVTVNDGYLTQSSTFQCGQHHLDGLSSLTDNRSVSSVRLALSGSEGVQGAYVIVTAG